MPASRIFRFARTSRWASVASGTRKARAISGVVEAADEAQRERDLRLRRERRVAAGEDQLEPFVGNDSLLVLRELLGTGEQLGLAGRASARDGSGRSPRSGPSSRSTRRDCAARRRAASAPPRGRTRPAPRPRRGRGHRGRGRGSRRTSPARRGRQLRARLCDGLVVGDDGAHLDRAELRAAGSSRPTRAPRRASRRRSGSSRRALPSSRRTARRS